MKIDYSIEYLIHTSNTIEIIGKTNEQKKLPRFKLELAKYLKITAKILTFIEILLLILLFFWITMLCKSM